MGALYQISFPNGKSYIGVTQKPPERRWAEHRYNSEKNREDRALNRALRKYGAVAATFRVLVVADDFNYLLNLERRAIAAYATFGRGGYNMTVGGEGSLGYRHTPESLAIMSATHKGRPYHGVPYTAEARAKMSAAQRGRKRSASFRAKVSAFMKGNQYALGTVQTQETIEKRKASLMTRSEGVSWCAYTKKWRAHITIDGKMKCKGRYADKADAIAARAAAVRQHLNGAMA